MSFSEPDESQTQKYIREIFDEINSGAFENRLSLYKDAEDGDRYRKLDLHWVSDCL